MSPAMQSPFIAKEIPCPACGAEVSQQVFRTRMYVPEEKESDQHVVRYHWLAENARPVHPPFYFLYQCPACHYTDLKDDYTDPKENPFFPRLEKAFGNAEKKEKLILEFLSRHVNYEEVDFESALNLHFMAVYIQLLAPEDARDRYKIGRLLLRTAWLYRENTPDAQGKLQVPAVDDILKALGKVETAVHQARSDWEGLSGAVQRRIASLEPEFREREDGNPYEERHATLRKRFEGFFNDLFLLKTVCEKDLKGELTKSDGGGAEESGEEAYHSFPSFGAYIEKLKSVWPLAPTGELEAMRMAASYFESSILTDRRFEDPQKHFSAISLITDLKVRCGDMDGAMAMVRGVYKSASDTRMRHQKELKAEDLTDRDKRRIKGKIEQAGYAVEQAGSLRKRLLGELMERDRPKIDALIAEREGEPPEEIEKALEEAGIPPELITRLKDKGGPLESKGKKKRRFF